MALLRVDPKDNSDLNDNPAHVEREAEEIMTRLTEEMFAGQQEEVVDDDGQKGGGEGGVKEDEEGAKKAEGEAPAGDEPPVEPAAGDKSEEEKKAEADAAAAAEAAKKATIDQDDDPEDAETLKTLKGLKLRDDAQPKTKKQFETLRGIAEKAVADGIKKIEKTGGSNAALVALDPKTGEILAMVGSRDFFDDEKRDVEKRGV